MRSHPAPLDIVSTLDPPEAAVIKWEGDTAVWREEGKGGNPMVVKLYRRRGWLTVLRSRLTRFRAEREYRGLQHLFRAGVPCTPPLAYAVGRCPHHGYCEVLVMREVLEAVPLDAYLEEGGQELDLAPLYRAVRLMHESGLCHQALYARNVLVQHDDGSGPRFVIADLPRARRFPGSIVDTGMALYDLLDLTLELTDRGVPSTAIPLEAYGKSSRFHRLREFWRGKDPRSKVGRFLRDAAVRVRWSAAWGGALAIELFVALGQSQGPPAT